jgi:hypothetical protein
MTYRRAAVALSLFTALAAPPWAAAQDVPPAVDALLKSWEKQFRIKPTYQSISGDAANATIEGLEASMAADPGSSVRLSVGRIELKNIADQGNGIIEIGQSSYSDLKMDIGAEGQTFTVVMPQAAAEGTYLKVLGDNPTPADEFRASLNITRKMTSGPITITAAGQTVSADGIEASWDGDPVTGAGKSSGRLVNLVVPEAIVEMMDPTGTLKQLGYASLAFDLGGDGTLSNDGTSFGMDFDGYLAARDAGTIRLGGGFAGIPIAALAELQKADPGKPEAMNALMPQFMAAQISRVEFRFEDASITRKVLPMIAAMQGMDEATFIANAGAMAQLGLAELKNPEFTQKAVAAISAFLNDPRSITVKAMPPAPVPVMQLMMVDPANPGASIDQLGISIEANN